MRGENARGRGSKQNHRRGQPLLVMTVCRVLASDTNSQKRQTDGFPLREPTQRQTDITEHKIKLPGKPHESE